MGNLYSEDNLSMMPHGPHPSKDYLTCVALFKQSRLFCFSDRKEKRNIGYYLFPKVERKILAFFVESIYLQNGDITTNLVAL